MRSRNRIGMSLNMSIIIGADAAKKMICETETTVTKNLAITLVFATTAAAETCSMPLMSIADATWFDSGIPSAPMTMASGVEIT